nr:PDZ domain containing protein [Haemonchus contortus]
MSNPKIPSNRALYLCLEYSTDWCFIYGRLTPTSVLTMSSKEGGEQMDIEIPMEEGEPLGATPNDKLIITKIQGGTISEGKLKVGDQILKVNGQPISDQNNFFKALRFAPPVAILTIIRDQKKAEELEARFRIPEERAKFIQRRDGFQYFLAKLVWVPHGPKLGLGIKHFQNRVLVSRSDPGSLSATQLQVGNFKAF